MMDGGSGLGSTLLVRVGLGVDDAVDDAGVVVDAVGGAVVLTVTMPWTTMMSLLMVTVPWATMMSLLMRTCWLGRR